jgi:ABC-type nitrate/sulfonate/bicarbonate transport system permease component
MNSERRDQVKVLTGRLVLVAICIALWEIATRPVVDPFFVSSPSRIAGYLFGEITDPGFYRDLYVSGMEMLLGFASGALTGIAAGVLLARWEIVAKIIDPFLVALNSIPPNGACAFAHHLVRDRHGFQGHARCYARFFYYVLQHNRRDSLG